MDTQDKSAAGLVTDALTRLSTLVREEINLAKSEVTDNVNRAAVAVGLLVGAVIVALTALHVLSAALVAALAELGLGTGWAALIVGGAYAIIAFAMVSKGVNDLKASSLAPTRTVENVKRDAMTLKEANNA